MRLAAHEFFRSGAGDNLVDAGLELALIYHCDPYIFLNRPAQEVADIYRRTNDILARQRAQQERED